MLNSQGDWPCSPSINFLHNWRCAGSTFSSLLSSNFHQSYLKVGHPFTSLGWPENYQKHRKPLITLQQLRQARQMIPGNACIIGGHMFMGLEAAIPGYWECWMNAREPIIRLSSGLLRFHNLPFNSGKSQALMVSKATKLDDPLQVDQLLRTTLNRESNGMCKRLAAFSLSDKPEIPLNEELERLRFLEKEVFESDMLFEAALKNLSNIRILILSDWLHESVLSIERVYGLTFPLINPFSNLRHNPVELGGTSHRDKRLKANCYSVLESHSKADLRLWPYLMKKFAIQVNQLNIDKNEVILRKLIHKEPLFLTKWFSPDGLKAHPDALGAMANSVVKRSREAGDLGVSLIETVLKWRRFTAETSDKLRDQINKIT